MHTIISLLANAINIYSYALIIYIFMSWFPQARETTFGYWLGRICEPYLEPFRRIVPPLGMMDFSPIVAFLVLNFAQYGVYQLAYFF